MDDASLLRRTGALLRAHPLPGLAAWLAMSGASIAIDRMGLGPGGDIFPSLVSTFAQFLLTSALLRRAGAHHAWGQPGRAAAFVVTGVVTGLAILFGTLLLILPGLYLYARWLVTMPLVIGEGCGVREAMRRSWRSMAGRVGPAMLAVAALLVPAVMLCVAPLFLLPALDTPVPMVLVLAIDLVFPASLVASWYLAVAAYLLVAAPAGAGMATDPSYMPPASTV